MRILDWLIEKRRERQRRNLARSIACEAFERAYPDSRSSGRSIHGRTPCRSWWLIDESTETARELSYWEASKIIPIAMWR